MTPLFFAPKDDILRMDIVEYPFLEKALNTLLKQFWIPEEIDLTQDHKEYQDLPEHIKTLYTRNLQYQSLLDTLVTRSFTPLFQPHASVGELESYIEAHGFSEMIHSKSYTHILRSVHTDPTPIFDEIMQIPAIAKRAASISKYLNDFAENPNIDTLYLACHQVNSLEGLRFYVSFACSFAIAETLGAMVKSAQIIKLIARDEVTHMVTFQQIIKTLDENTELRDKHSEAVYDMYMGVVEEEEAWADYLFPEGTAMLGLNAELLKRYTQYLANIRLQSVGKLPMYPIDKNPIPWIDKWLNSDAAQTAPQELENTSYLTGATDGNLDLDKHRGFQL